MRHYSKQEQKINIANKLMNPSSTCPGNSSNSTPLDVVFDCE